MKDFNIAKYLRENHLGSHAILGHYVDLHALNEAPDYNRLRPDELKKLADAGDFTAQRILQKMDDDATQKMKAQDSNPNDDGDCPQGMTPDPVFGCIREREEFNHGQQESDEVPYVGADPKIDGFGDTFDQVDPVEEAEEEDGDEDISWMKDDRFADLGGDQIKASIKSLMDDGFDGREIAQFVVDTIRAFKK